MAILVCPLSKVSSVIASRAPSHVVSLLDPHSAFPDASHDRRHLKVGVHDITEDMAGWTAPGRPHLTEILEFIGSWERAAPILIHCYAGISRSTATAFITACVHNPGVDEEAIAWTLRRASAVAWPNRRIVALADAELGRGGRMVRAIDAIGRGRSWEEAGENTPFEIPSTYAAPA
ncbi:MAG: hypothetical protein NW200_10240 [Hyphomonadaceae bacterium]|nr:hypothetical protein [Hyphomonadaceae bacterium]